MRTFFNFSRKWINILDLPYSTVFSILVPIFIQKHMNDLQFLKSLHGSERSADAAFPLATVRYPYWRSANAYSSFYRFLEALTETLTGRFRN
jgi:hypothetical protein